MPVEVMPDHLGMTHMTIGIELGAAENLADERGDVGGMLSTHPGEHRREQIVPRDLRIKSPVSRSSFSIPPIQS